jgi:hypothetical protein
MTLPIDEKQHCEKCLYSTIRRVRTGDSWEYECEIYCSKIGKVIFECLDFFDKPEVPDYCHSFTKRA